MTTNVQAIQSDLHVQVAPQPFIVHQEVLIPTVSTPLAGTPLDRFWTGYVIAIKGGDIDDCTNFEEVNGFWFARQNGGVR